MTLSAFHEAVPEQSVLTRRGIGRFRLELEHTSDGAMILMGTCLAWVIVRDGLALFRAEGQEDACITAEAAAELLNRKFREARYPHRKDS